MIDKVLLQYELYSFEIRPHRSGYSVAVGDEIELVSSLLAAQDLVKKGIKELKQHLWETWQDLGHIAYLINHNTTGNQPDLDNVLFLNSVKRSYLLSHQFDELEDISDTIFYLLFNTNITEVCQELIKRFNLTYLKIKALHKMVLRELYRLRLLRACQRFTRQAQISGTWANLDLPMSERMWSAEEDEEYFDNREKARHRQIRYNPENQVNGFFMVWQDLSRDPYRFDDIATDSPYKSRSLLTIP